MTPDRELVEMLRPLRAERGVDMIAARKSSNGHGLEPDWTEEPHPAEQEQSPFPPDESPEEAQEVEPEAARLRVVPLSAFAAEEEASAEPLLGTADDMILAAGGLLILYGDGGTAKTTLTLDAAFHMAAGIPWLGIEVAAE
jgi:hypothetical protein